MKNKPLVTIGAFNYNNARFVIETLDSIKNQTYDLIELIIIDDASTDNSVELINEWLKNYDKPHNFQIHSQNKGLKVGLSEAFDLASGKYFSIIATDDVIVFDKIELQVDFIEKCGNEVAMVYGDCAMIDENGKIIHQSMFDVFKEANFIPPSGDIFKDIIEDFYFYSQASLININLFKDINFVFDDKIISEDWDMELAISRKYLVFGNRHICTKYRKVSTSVTSRIWADEKKHLVYESHFLMLSKYLNNSLNTKEENLLIINKLKSFYWLCFESNKMSYKKKVIYFSKIFKQTKKIRDLIILVKLILYIK